MRNYKKTQEDNLQSSNGTVGVIYHRVKWACTMSFTYNDHVFRNLYNELNYYLIVFDDKKPSRGFLSEYDHFNIV